MKIMEFDLKWVQVFNEDHGISSEMGTRFLMKIMEFDLKWVQMIWNELIITKEKAIWLKNISRPRI